MTTVAATSPVDPEQDRETALDLWHRVKVPEGSRAEVVAGAVTVALPPTNGHNAVADLIQRRLYTAIPEEWGVYQRLALALRSCDSLNVPDLAVVSRAELKGGGTSVPAASAKLVVEITQWNDRHHDTELKPTGYAAEGVPLYLLVDLHAPGGPLITLYGEPFGDVYRVLAEVKFGEEIHLPAPFELTLDTSEFPTVK
jgi:hypothetical protein